MYHTIAAHRGDDIEPLERGRGGAFAGGIGTVGPLRYQVEVRGQDRDDVAEQPTGESRGRGIGEEQEASHRLGGYRSFGYAGFVRYRDRADAGSRLADAIVAQGVIGVDVVPLVLGVPRGGVPVAVEVAQRIGADVDVLVAHKLGAPGNPEFAIGAVAEDGSYVVDEDLLRRLGVRDTYVKAERERQAEEVKRRAESYRRGRPAIPIDGRVCIVVDDGVATGSTLQAAITLVGRRDAARVIVAVPVGPSESIRRLADIADAVVCPLEPEPFFAVGGWYDRFDQVSDAEVVRFLEKSA